MDVLADDEWDDECSHCCEYAVDDDRAEMVVMEMEMGMEMVMVFAFYAIQNSTAEKCEGLVMQANPSDIFVVEDVMRMMAVNSKIDIHDCHLRSQVHLHLHHHPIEVKTSIAFGLNPIEVNT